MTYDVATELVKILKDTQVFVVGQAPDVFQQMLLQGTFDACMHAGLGLLFFGISAVIIFLALRAYKKEEDIYSLIGGLILSALPLIIATALTFCNISTLYKIKHAPKVYLLEELSDLVRSEK